MFSSLDHVESRKNAVVVSTVFHGVMIFLLLLVPFLLTEQLNLSRYSVVLIEPPIPREEVLEITPYRAPVIAPKPVERMILPPPRIPELKKPEVRPPEIPEPKVAELELPRKPVEPAFTPETPRPAPPREVRTNVFGENQKATLDAPAREVQTGGFGDPNGARGQGNPDKVANVASLGSFDLPTGPGAGNGTGGARGARGVVASAGFGGAESGNTKGSPRAAVQEGAFGSSPAASPKEVRRDAGPAQIPVEITYKPRPDYTAEAREKKLQGEVLLRVLFSASGEVRILNMVRGLGYGLDENAIRAAQQIRFTPAKRDGKPVDSTATIHIVFQLAY